MNTRFVQAAVLGVLLCAGLPAAARSKSPPSPPQAAIEVPSTCEEQCELMDDLCSSPCKSARGKGRASCSSQCQQLTNVCKDSCREKGRVDGEYMRERIKPPKRPRGSREEDHADAL